MILALSNRLIQGLRHANSSALGNLKPLASINQQTCNEWTDARMRKDVRKRIANSQHASLKSRLKCLQRNAILPDELKESAREEMMKLPTDCLGKKIVWRCAVTSRPRGIVYRWRVSRIVFRHLSDYNKLSGVMRAMW